MNRPEIILSAVLFLSVIFNIGVFVYARAAITRLLFVSEELGDLQDMIDAFAKHVKSVYELEMFEYIYSLTEETAEEGEEESGEELDDNSEEIASA